jgi:hypothetical protein
MTLEPDIIRDMVEASDHGPKKILAYLENNLEKKI